MGTSCFPGADAGDMAVEIEDRIAVLMAPRTGFHLAQTADGGGFLELVHPFRPECRRGGLPDPTALVKVVVPIGESSMFLRVDAHAVEPEEFKMLLLPATIAVGVAVFDIRQRCKRERLGKCGLTDPGHRHRGLLCADSLRQSQCLVDIGAVPRRIDTAVAVHAPIGRHERDGVLVVVQIPEHTQRKLFHDVVTGGTPRPFPRIVQRGQQKPGKDGDDRYNDKKFNQSKIFFHHLLPVGPISRWFSLFSLYSKNKKLATPAHRK